MKVLKKKDWLQPGGFPVVVVRRDPQEPFGLHTHEFSEIVIITGGQGLHVTGNDSHELSAGDTFVIGGERSHDYANMKQLRLINVLFDPTNLPMSLGDLQSLPGYHALFTLEPAWRKRHQFKSRLKLAPADLAEAVQLVDRLDQELIDRGPGFGVMATTLFLQLATFLSRCYSRSRNSDNKSLLRIAESISYLETHYASPIKLSELVHISGMSRRNFLRAFEAAMGHPPIAYLIRLRVRQACRLLQRDKRTITEIAQAVGFSDGNYFTRQFRALTGVTPKEFRNRRPLIEQN